MIIDVLTIVLVLMLIGSIPAWPYSRNWGYVPSGGIGVIVLVLMMLVMLNVV